jgi:hypothetical protein
MLPLAVPVGWFLWISLPRYLGYDRHRTPVPLDPRYHLQYPLLVAHVMFGTVAIVGACVQIWPWLRQRYPGFHRWAGRVYVFGGAIPAATLALALMPASQSPVGNGAGAVFWLTVTIIGLRMARAGREAEHRRFMIYSFAMATQIIWGRIAFYALKLVPGTPVLADPHNAQIFIGATPWIGFVINLIAAQIYLEWSAARRPAAPEAVT